MVRSDLGPDAAVLHTREVQSGMLRWLTGRRQVEVTASATVNVPSRFAGPSESAADLRDETHPPAAHRDDYRAKFREDLKAQIEDLHSMVEDLCRKSADQRDRQHDLPETLFQLYADLIDAEVSEEVTRELIERLREGVSGDELADPVLLKARLIRLVEDQISCVGPLDVRPGERKIVALVGPTGVGKTTTIAKLAANHHLKLRQRVGLITVDTYRMAAVDQLRTYADIIDLPMEVVSTPRQMRAAVSRLSNLELIFVDTAGRSPRDEVRIQELKSLLAEAQPEEVYLVLSGVASASSMCRTAERFSEVGVTSLVLTKLDEATGLGNLLPVLKERRLPLSYVTNGQNVPDDIAAADRRQLARFMLGREIAS